MRNMQYKIISNVLILICSLVLERKPERIVIRLLRGLQSAVRCIQHSTGTGAAQVVGLEVIVRVARSGGTLRAGYRSFGMEHVQQLIVMAVNHHRAVVSQRTVRIAGKFLA